MKVKIEINNVDEFKIGQISALLKIAGVDFKIIDSEEEDQQCGGM